jgi:hypothetical protein
MVSEPDRKGGMTTRAAWGGGTTVGRASATFRQQVRWIAGGLAFGFLVPFLFADLAEIPRDLYYAIYAVAVVGFLAAWLRATDQRLGEMLRRHWIGAVALGVICAGVMAAIVVGAEDATPRPGGAELAGAVLWRGVIYGVIDGLLLSAFPILAVFAAFAGTRLRTRWQGKLAVGALALLASLAMTAVYHLGYSQFRSSDLRSPLVGDVVWSAPTLITLNPIGSPIAHVGLHTSAVLHSYDTDLFLPPSSGPNGEATR